MRVRMILPIDSPDSSTCNKCGEGSLAFGIVQVAGAPAPQYAFHCGACSFLAPA